MPLPLYISVPAWTPPYVELAVKYTIPAALASIKDRVEPGLVRFLIHTDDRDAYRRALEGYDCFFFPLAIPNGRDGKWVAFKQAHRDTLSHTPKGAISVLLNSDIVCSRETFPFIDKVFKDERIKVIASVGIRTLIDGNTPPIGVSAKKLNKWIWDHPHPITQECIWQGGRSQHPTILFFKDGKNVSMHCFHQTPMFVRKDRQITFRGTIDDDVLVHYRDDEIFYPTEGQVAFAELSPAWKTHPFGIPLSVDSVLGFDQGRPGRRFRPAHIRNFKQRFTVLGNPKANHPAVDEIIRRLPC